MAKKQETQHTTLYRAYRPQSFKDVRGQEHVTSVLEEAIRKDQIAHAYLFAGGRGTGKTTTARIFAREIGCNDKDLYEIDAASNRGIDDMRELREGVHVLPFESRYKVYIIDEVHMLTKEAFNAFLKTLEEPPAHAVFILATTERDRVPDTIQSRCEVYTFKQPTRALLSEMLTDVAKDEGYKLEPPAADLVAQFAEGSFRDALSILQKVLTVTHDKKIDLAEIETVTGAPTGSLVGKLFEALATKDAAAALGAIREASESNMDARLLAKLLMQRVRAALLLRYAPDIREQLEREFSPDAFQKIDEAARAVEGCISSATLRSLLTAYADMGYAALPFVPLELAVIDLTSVQPEAVQ